MDGTNIIGILVHDYFPKDECQQLFNEAKFLFNNGGKVEHSKLRSEERMVMFGSVIDTWINSVND
jgi:hypothetical protein